MGRANRKGVSTALRQKPQVDRKKHFQSLESKKLNVIYASDDQKVQEVAQAIEELRPGFIGLDFETASKNGRYGVDNGSLRLIQIGLDDPEAGIPPTQIVVDCFKASPKPLLGILRNPEIEKQIHNMSFEQEWSQIQLGARIHNAYDTCIAFRVIQNHLKEMDEKEVQKLLPGWKQHDNKLSTLIRIYMDMEMPKDGQSSDWSREKLLPQQVKYAAMDAAVMPLLTERVKAIAEHVGCKDAVEEKIASEDRRINSRMRTKKKNGEDDSVRIERALARAASKKELERLWQSRSQMTLFSDSKAKLRATYKKRKTELLDRPKGSLNRKG